MLIITPICPHSLQSNSYVVGGRDTVYVRLRRQEDLGAVMLDGQEYFEFGATRTDLPYKMRSTGEVSKNKRSELFFALLKEKLAEWSAK